MPDNGYDGSDIRIDRRTDERLAASRRAYHRSIEHLKQLQASLNKTRALVARWAEMLSTDFVEEPARQECPDSRGGSGSLAYDDSPWPQQKRTRR